MIDQLYTAYINVLAARETLRYSEAFLIGIRRITDQAEAERKQAAGGELDRRDPDALDDNSKKAKALSDAVAELHSQDRQAEYQVREAAQVLMRTTVHAWSSSVLDR